MKNAARFEGLGVLRVCQRRAGRDDPGRHGYSYHQQNGAVDTTSVQFYPMLLPIARAKEALTATISRKRKPAYGNSRVASPYGDDAALPLGFAALAIDRTTPKTRGSNAAIVPSNPRT